MRHSVASARAVCRTSWPSVWRTACELALAVALLAACVGAPPPPAVKEVAFTDLVANAQSSYTGSDPRLLLTRRSDTDTIEIEASMGQQRTAGYAIRVDRVAVNGPLLLVYATFTTPAPGAILAQVITSPSQRVSVWATGVAGARDARLLDQTGAVRAGASIP